MSFSGLPRFRPTLLPARLGLASIAVAAAALVLGGARAAASSWTPSQNVPECIECTTNVLELYYVCLEEFGSEECRAIRENVLTRVCDLPCRGPAPTRPGVIVADE